MARDYCKHGYGFAITCRACTRGRAKDANRQVGPVSETSRDAQKRASAGSSATVEAVYSVLDRRGPLTDDGIADLYAVSGYPAKSDQGLRGARLELQRAGRVRKVDQQTGLSRRGGRAALWEVV